MYDKLFLIFFAFGLSRVANCVQDLIQKKQEDIDEKIKYHIYSPNLKRNKRVRSRRILQQKIDSDENLKKLDKQRKSIERIALWEIAFWILFFFYYFFNLEKNI